MKKHPLYESLRQSFSKDIYMPSCGLIAAPTVVLEIKNACDIDKLSSSTPPQNVVLHVDSELFVSSSQNQRTEDLYTVLSLADRCVPIICFDSRLTLDRLARFIDLNNVGDAILCVKYANRELLVEAYNKMPLLRCMLDMREEKCIDVESLPSEALSHNATSVILPEHLSNEENIHFLSQRFIHVITTDSCGFAEMASEGAHGIITEDVQSAYDILAVFPENSFLRRRNLFAHKGFQNGGIYSENTISGVVAAAENHFDGAEIDVKLTSDNVPVVMHNTNTVGLFDCEAAVTEESSYEFLSSLRRIGFEEESIDRFDDLMFAMKKHKDTPVLIELKPSAKYHKVEKLVSLTDEILNDERAQKNCICIMGALDPGLRLVHKRLPYLPVSHCEGGKSVPPSPQSREEAEDRLYRVALITEGCAAGYNCEDTNINRLFNEYAKFRMLTVFPWSRSWTLSPSKWEVNGPDNDKTYLAGYDAWTTDHGEKYLDLPIRIEYANKESARGGRGMLVYRDGSKEEACLEVFRLNNEKAMLSHRIDLHFGDSYLIYSKPFELN